MRIAPINIAVNPLFGTASTNPERTARPTLRELGRDMFVRSPKTIHMPKDFGGRKLTIKDYKEVRRVDIPEILNRNPEALQAANENVPMGIGLKKNLDKKYGKNNYVFVSIGRSPASIGRVLEFSGVEVKYVPASALNSSCCYSPSEMAGYFNFVLSKQELTKEKAEENFKSSGKKVLVFDYTVSGKSLKKAKEVMRRLGYESEFTDFLSLNSELANAPPKFNMGEAAENYNYRVCRQAYKQFSGITCADMKSYDFAHNKDRDDLYLEDLRYLAIKNIPDEKPAYYNMAVMHLLQKAGLLKENKANRAAL